MKTAYLLPPPSWRWPLWRSCRSLPKRRTLLVPIRSRYAGTPPPGGPTRGGGAVVNPGGSYTGGAYRGYYNRRFGVAIPATEAARGRPTGVPPGAGAAGAGASAGIRAGGARLGLGCWVGGRLESRLVGPGLLGLECRGAGHRDTVSEWSVDPAAECDHFIEREVETTTQPAQPAQQWWYWCASSRAYYPYVETVRKLAAHRAASASGNPMNAPWVSLLRVGAIAATALLAACVTVPAGPSVASLRARRNRGPVPGR